MKKFLFIVVLAAVCGIAHAQPPYLITAKPIYGVASPVAGETPSTDIDEDTEFTASLFWNDNPGMFDYETIYTATITLTAKDDYTFSGDFASVGDIDGFTVNGHSPTELIGNYGNELVFEVEFPETTALVVVSLAAIDGVTVPVAGATPDFVITPTNEFTGSVTWSPNHNTFDYATIYTATITLTPKAGFTLTGVVADFFTVAGATTVSNLADDGVITAEFPATEDAVINISAILGVTPPFASATPVTDITETAQYTGTVEWSPNDDPFGYAKIYTATITLIPKAGFTLTGVTANFFTLSGATTVSNSINSGIITAVFPKTVDALVTAEAINGILSPVNLATPATTITPTDQYTGSVEWFPTHNPFNYNQEYRATITLTAKDGYTFSGGFGNTTAISGFTVNGIAPTWQSNNGSTLVFWVAFPPATPALVTAAAIYGVTSPQEGATPSTGISNGTGFSAALSWNGNPPTFGFGIAYTATITLTATTGYTFIGNFANTGDIAGFTVNGYAPTDWKSNNGNILVFEVEFPATTPPAAITLAAINGLTPPVAGATPVTAITPTVQYTGTVSWLPNDDPFDYNTVYTATITLAPEAGYTFAGLPANFFTVAGATSVSFNSSTGVITAAFPITALRPVTAAPITGVTSPVALATPSTSINNGTGFTAQLSWMGTPPPTIFGYGTSYTAIITLTAAGGYTFSNVFNNTSEIENFTVNNIAPTWVSNNGTTLVFTITFPPTGQQLINATAITGVISPVANVGASTAITGGTGFTASLSWNGSPTTFDYNTTYTATITLTAVGSYTFEGGFGNTTAISGFTVNGIAPIYEDNTGSTLVFTVTFPQTGPRPITAQAISGVTSPVATATPSTGINPGTGFTASLAWDGNPSAFGYSTAYTATITLTAIDGYTFSGIGSIAGFTVNTHAPTLVSNIGTELVFKVTFPVTGTAPTLITATPIGGVTSPVATAIPSTVINHGTGFYSSLTWDGDPSTFGYSTSYTATITLTAYTGYTFSGIGSIAGFTVNGFAPSLVSNSGSQLVFKVMFPATATLVTATNITGITVPATGATPVTTISGTQYNGTVTWSPNQTTFSHATSYTATITLTANTGYTLAGISANYFNVAGATSVTHLANSNVVIAVFPATADAIVTLSAIGGVTKPIAGQTPATTITATDEYSGTVLWTPHNGVTFDYATQYTAVITLTVKPGYTLTGLGANFFTVADATPPVTTTINSPSSATIVAVFPHTNPATTFAISAITQNYSFGSVQTPYPQPSPQLVEITNVGTGSVTLTQPTSTKYNITQLSTLTLATTGDKATFWIQPNTGLSVGNHDETITISGTNGTSTSINASFSVTSVPTYLVTVNNGTGGGYYEAVQTVLITADNAQSGMRFKEWEINHAVTFVSGTNQNSLAAAFTMPAHPVMATATYEIIPPNNYTITVSTDGNGTANASSLSAQQGTLITLTATANERYQFKEWQVISGGIIITNTTPAIFVMPNNAVDVKAIFEQKAHTVTVVGGAGATGGGNYAVGATVTITAGTPPAGQQFKNWTTLPISNSVTFANPASANTTFEMPDYAVTVMANFELIPYSVTVQSAGAGASGSGYYTAGTTVNINAGTPPQGQRFRNWTTTSPGVAFAKADDPSTFFTMPSNVVTVTANFVPIYAVTVESGSGSNTYAVGDIVTITANTAPIGKEFKEWTYNATVNFTDNTSATSPIAKFIMPNNAVTIIATYKDIPPDNHLITVSDDGNGDVYASPPSAQKGTQVRLTAYPKIGYQFKEWLIISGDITLSSTTTTPATFTMPDNAVEVKAIFEQIPYAVTVIGGDDATGGGNYAAGVIVSINAGTPPAGQQFKQWNITPAVTFAEGTSATSQAAKFVMPAQAVTATATYEPIPPENYEINVWDDGNGIANASHLSAPQGTIVTLTATANNDYKFKKWEVGSGGITLSDATANPATFVMPGNKVVVVATFEDNKTLFNPPVPMFDGLKDIYIVEELAVLLKVAGTETHTFVFKVDGKEVREFNPSAVGIYLVEAISEDGKLRIWKYVTVKN